MTVQKASTSDYAELYRKTLLEDVIPFWMRHAFDSEDGAINNCLDDYGCLQSKDRFIWSQGRALWTFSALYSRIEPRADWLEAAHGIFRYLQHHGRDSEGRWMYRLDEHGKVLETDISIYVDSFVLNGLGEYFKATGNTKAADLALETFRNTYKRLQTSGSYGIAPYSIPEGMKPLGVPMIFSFFFYNLGKIIGSLEMLEAGRRYAYELIESFYIVEKDAVLEFVTQDGRFKDIPESRVCIPGHVIEAMWFLISIFEDTGDTELIQRCCKLIRRHIELSWDEAYGGIRLAVDMDGKEPVCWQKPDYKPWWVQTEALVATAYAYLHTGENWCLDWHGRVSDYAFTHYPVSTGEWTQWLDRQGNKGETAALPVKDPFHLPRALIYLIDLFENRIPAAECDDAK